MTIKKYNGKTKEDALRQAKDELGDDVVVMNTREIKPGGFFWFIKKPSFEITAAIEIIDRKSTIEKPQSKIEERLDDLHRILKDQFFQTEKTQEKSQIIDDGAEFDLDHILQPESNKGTVQQSGETKLFMKMLYEKLTDNEVNETYVNQFLDELAVSDWNQNSVDKILSNVYQKMILKFGRSNAIRLNKENGKIVFFIGPTGVGKTTTIAKIASNYKVESGCKIAFLTADTYRIAAAEQLRIYANILDAPMHIIYTKEDLADTLKKLTDFDLILIDTAGFSHHSQQQKEDVKALIESVPDQYAKEVFLVLSATTKYIDLKEIVDVYKEIAEYSLIFTKLDETSAYGNLFNIRLYSEKTIAYITNGQNVPNDIEEFDSQKIVKRLLGGR